jgi:hypothetical protein
VALLVAVASAAADTSAERDLQQVPGAHAHLREQVPCNVPSRSRGSAAGPDRTEDDASPCQRCNAIAGNAQPHGNIRASPSGNAPSPPARPAGAEMGGRSPGLLFILASDAEARATAAEAAAGVQRDDGSRKHVRPGTSEACGTGARQHRNMRRSVHGSRARLCRFHCRHRIDEVYVSQLVFAYKLFRAASGGLTS